VFLLVWLFGGAPFFLVSGLQRVKPPAGLPGAH
jgi:hypothetical protein